MKPFYQNCQNLLSYLSTPEKKDFFKKLNFNQRKVAMGICGSKKPVETIPSFKLFIRYAKNLKKMDAFSHSDPYVKVRVLDLRTKDSKKPYKQLKEMKQFTVQTSVKQNKKNPEWDEIFIMNDIPAKFSRIVLEVWDKDKYSRNDFMGKSELNLAKWDMKKKEYVCRVDNDDLPLKDRLEMPVDKVDQRLFPNSNKDGKPKSKVQGTITYSLTRERITEGKFMN